MPIDQILIGNANTYFLNDFRNALTGSLESDVEAYLSICETPPTDGAGWKVKGASNHTPIVITSEDHGLTTGDQITIVNVGDNRGAHGTFTVTVIDADSFSLNSSAGVAAWTRGGQFYRCIQDAAGLSFDLTGSGQYQCTVDGDIGLEANTGYVIVAYCQGAYRDLFNQVNHVTAVIRGN